MPGTDEEWRPVLGFEGLYEVSNLGRIRSLPRVSTHPHSGTLTVRGRILKVFPRLPDGYLFVTLYSNGRRIGKSVHRLVAEAFIPNPDSMPLVLHGNDTPDDNRVDNLRWGNHSQNAIDARNNGRNAHSNKTHCKQGHGFTAESVVNKERGWRQCKVCARLRRNASK